MTDKRIDESVAPVERVPSLLRENRACGCDEGRVYVSAVPTGWWTECPRCGGTGRVSVYVYGGRR